MFDIEIILKKNMILKKVYVVDLGYELKLEQRQKLYITNELKQAFNILQLPVVELKEYIENAVVENPLLEFAESQGKEVFEWQKYFEQQRTFKEEVVDREQNEFSFEHFVTQEKTLAEHLLEQLSWYRLNVKKQIIAEALIGNLDSIGYLRVSIEELVPLFNTTLEEVLIVLELIQGFDPPGIAARDLKECLILQVKGNPEYELLTRIIQEHLEDVASNRIVRISEALGQDLKRIQEVVDIIKSLNPKPGASISGNHNTGYIIPDIYLEEINGEYVILVNDILIPRLKINNFYFNLLKEKCQTTDESVQFLEEKLNRAKWLLKNIEQRRMTLYRVTNVIVGYQKQFFKQGIKFLKPLILKDVANELEIHESTVSRAIANKYIQTSKGTFELKWFFSNYSSNEGESQSKEGIKAQIKELIESEDSKAPYSDQQLVKLLLDKGIKLARRTVSKYREELNIGNAQHRKRY